MSAAPASDFLPFTRPTIDDATIAGVTDVLRSGWITSGPQVKAFEAKLSEYCGGRPVRAFNSGTCTMEIALRLAGIGPGHEVITTPLSWVATSNVVLAVGAKPVFVDIDPATRNIDLARAEAAITPATRAIIPVDLSGLPVDRDRLYALAQKHRLRVVGCPSPLRLGAFVVGFSCREVGTQAWVGQPGVWPMTLLREAAEGERAATVSHGG